MIDVLIVDDHPYVRKLLRQLIEIGEFDDMGTLFAFGQAGGGVFPASAVMAKELTKQYRVRVLGRLETARLRFFAFTCSSEPKHPVVIKILESAKQRLAA